MMIWVWDVPILIVLGMVLAGMHARWFAVKRPDFFVHAATLVIALFWLNSLLSAFGAHPWCCVENIRRVRYAIALFYVLSYPMWFMFGAERIFALFGRRPTQGGFLWPFTLKDRTKPFEPPWKS